MSLHKTILCILAVVVPALPVASRLPAITFQDFQAQAPCGYVVDVLDVRQDAEYLRQFEEKLLAGEAGELQPDIQATMRIQRALGSTKECSCQSKSVPQREFTMVFFSEAHSSHPASGDRAVVFPRSIGGEWRESIYGASYWRLFEGSTSKVKVGWRNEFIKGMLKVEVLVSEQFMEIGAADLQDIIDLWGGDITSAVESCWHPPGRSQRGAPPVTPEP